jgi:hypothetical protein
MKDKNIFKNVDYYFEQLTPEQNLIIAIIERTVNDFKQLGKQEFQLQYVRKGGKYHYTNTLTNLKEKDGSHEVKIFEIFTAIYYVFFAHLENEEISLDKHLDCLPINDIFFKTEIRKICMNCINKNINLQKIFNIVKNNLNI